MSLGGRWLSRDFSPLPPILRPTVYTPTPHFPLARLFLTTWLIVWIALPPLVWANPSGGTVTTGSAQINGGAGHLTVNQSSQRAVIRWNSFSNNAGETTTFVQPNSSSATLNRVTGGSASQLNGTLNANGKIYLINPNGVVIGKSGRVNAASFTASTHDVTDKEFMAGGDMTFRGSSKASVVNHGKIRATEGDVTLIARQVENTGKLTAKKGSVNLAGGMEVLVKPSADANGQRVFIRAEAGPGSVSNSGKIRAVAAELRAAGGNEYALAVNNSGVIRATSVDRSGGRIVLRAESGIAQNSGKLIATSSAPGKDGGSVVVSAPRVRLTPTSKIDVSSKYAKGGTAKIGGGFQGKDTTVGNAEVTVVEQGSSIKADGGTTGGTVIVWSDVATGYYGDISAKGSGAPKSGGFVEVSSLNLLDMLGTVDTGGGTLLLDPSNITISTGANSAILPPISGTDETTATSTGATSILNVNYLTTTLLASNNVVVRTSSAFNAPGGLFSGITGDSGNGDIAVTATVDYTSAFNLTLLAHDDILVFAPIVNHGTGSINLVAGWDGSLTDPVGGHYYDFAAITGRGGYGSSDKNGGSVFINRPTGAPVNVGSAGGETNVAGYNVIVRGSTSPGDAYAQIGYRGDTSSTAAINVFAVNNVRLVGGDSAGSFAQIGHGGRDVTAGDISGSITVLAGNDVVLAAGDATRSYAQIGHGGAESDLGQLVGSIYVQGGNNVSLTAGFGEGSYAQIGFGGETSFNSGSEASIDVYTSNLTLQGRNAYNAYAQIGNGGADFTSSGRAAGNITIQNTRSITMTGGINDGSYVQIGNGGIAAEVDGDFSGYITIFASDALSLNAGRGQYSYAQIGNGGALALGNYIDGDIRITGGTAVTLQGGLGDDNYAQIGHGGLESGVDTFILGNIGVEARSIRMEGGTGLGAGEDNYVLIGHGGTESGAGRITGNIDLGFGTSLQVLGGNTFNSYAMIGHGGTAELGGCGCGTGGIVGDIRVTGTGDITLRGGNVSEGTMAQIGHGGAATLADSMEGNITIVGNNISVLGGESSLSYAHIGHDGSGNFGASSPTIAGNINVTFGQNLLVFGGTNTGGSFAQIGHGGVNPFGIPLPMASSITGDITVTGGTSSFVSLVAGNGCDCYTPNYALIGHGGLGWVTDIFNSQPGFIEGDITVTAGSLYMAGGGFHDSFAQIGHHNVPSDFIPPVIPMAPLSGNIRVALTGDLTMIGGIRDAAGTMIGHGGLPVARYGGARSGQIVLLVGGETSLVLGAQDTSHYWIGHRTFDADLVTNADILFSTGTLDADAFATSDTTTGNIRFARMLGTALQGGNVTFISTNTQGGMIYGGTDPSVTRDTPYTLSLLSMGNLTFNAPIENTNALSNFFAVAGFDGTSGILGVFGAPLVDSSRFTAPSARDADLTINANLTFGNNTTFVAGGSLINNAAIRTGGHFLAITDNVNAVRPSFDLGNVFHNFGSISASSVSIFAVAPESVILGDIGGFNGQSIRGVWFGDANAIVGINYKLTLPPVPADIVPALPTVPLIPSLTAIPGFQDNSDDRLRKVERLRVNQQFSIFYAETKGLPAFQRAQLWLNSYQVLPSETTFQNTLDR
ncbi:hypothetical protein DB346_01555 [Verrucomicrobia bacterium LW23]|nr:hypothetical protein DB346_01555 [Verrucomicrobia bacterium LW23]